MLLQMSSGEEPNPCWAPGAHTWGCLFLAFCCIPWSSLVQSEQAQAELQMGLLWEHGQHQMCLSQQVRTDLVWFATAQGNSAAGTGCTQPQNLL